MTREPNTPSLPALISDLPADADRPPQTQFDRARQVTFLEALSVSGSVRSASARAQVSHQSVYRARRAVPAFRRAWVAALLVARSRAAAVLAERAIEGLEEDVWYHGEVVGTRRRYSDRLLLAHLARLDTLAADEDAARLAEDFDAVLARFGAGEGLDDPSPVRPERAGGQADQANVLRQAQHERREEVRGEEVRCEEGGDEPGEDADSLADGLCNRWSMSPEPMAHAERLRNRIPPPGYPEWEPDMDDPAHWDRGEYIPPLARRLRAMDAARPADAPALHELGDPGEAEALQLAAFEAGDPDWWRAGAEKDEKLWEEEEQAGLRQAQPERDGEGDGNTSVRPELVEGQADQAKGLRQDQPERVGEAGEDGAENAKPERGGEEEEPPAHSAPPAPRPFRRAGNQPFPPGWPHRNFPTDFPY